VTVFGTNVTVFGTNVAIARATLGGTNVGHARATLGGTNVGGISWRRQRQFVKIGAAVSIGNSVTALHNAH
jgi:hypothetical protein